MVEAVVGGVNYKNVMQGPLLQALRKADVEHSRLLSEYMFALAVCHTVSIGEVISEEEIREKKNSPWKHLFTKMSKVFKSKRSEANGQRCRCCRCRASQEGVRLGTCGVG